MVAIRERLDAVSSPSSRLDTASTAD
eukprot:COSAG02_NODE_4779_length_4988_cov_1.897116_1_plen_25_part_10